jgi:tRNA nucleotidyltransferase/poly(A) polymerase
VRDKVGVEITTLREDIETSGRHAVVRFGRDWQADAQRRDFTMNALSVTADGTVHDYTGGMADLAARRLRFIGDAQARIREDYLRILRFFRFHATYGAGAPDAEGLHACIVGRTGLAGLSRERVRAELVKLLVAPRAVETVQVVADSGILGDVLGGVAVPALLARLAALETELAVAPHAMRRLAVLAVMIPEDAERLDERLRLSKAERAVLDALASRAAPDTLPAVRAALYRDGVDLTRHRLLAGWTRSGQRADKALWDETSRFLPPACPFRGSDLIAAGLEPGPFVGHALKEAEALWIKQDFPEDPAIQRAILTEVLTRHRM